MVTKVNSWTRAPKASMSFLLGTLRLFSARATRSSNTFSSLSQVSRRLVLRLGELVVGDLLGALLDGFAFLDQRLENLAALYLRLAEGAKAGEPYLTGELADFGDDVAIGLFQRVLSIS